MKNMFPLRLLGFVVPFMLVAVFVQFVVRVAFMLTFLPADDLLDNANRLCLFALNALRFDAQIAAYAALPIALLVIMQLFFGQRFFAFATLYARFWAAFVSTLLVMLGIADIQFYRNFQSHFNIVIFDLFDEDPLVLMRGVLHEAPVFVLLLSAAVAFVAVYFLWKPIAARILAAGRSRLAVLAVITILVVPIAIRGSLGVFTLRGEDTYVSPSAKLNACVPNAAFMLNKAWSDKKRMFRPESDEEILARWGFSSVDEAWTECSDGQADTLSLFALTGSNPVAKGYNVVLIVVESWSNLLIDYDREYQMDLLCDMRRHMNDDLVFRNFLSAPSGTIDAMESFTVASPYAHLFDSQYRFISYPTATAEVFRRQGYSTHFISGIEIAWRNLNQILPRQGFDEVIGKYELLRDVPTAETNHTWGVYDADMLQYTLSRLKQSADSPRFIMCLTSTSHTPFEFPESVDFPPLTTPTEAFATSPEITADYLHGYQYENMALGLFLDSLKASPLAENTIVAITGDHNIRQILRYDKLDNMWQHSVPLYLYLPESLRPDLDVDVEMAACHDDIFPTLFNLTLDSARYFCTGRDLLRRTPFSLGVHADCVISSGLSHEQALRKANARRALSQLFFQRVFTSSR